MTNNCLFKKNYLCITFFLYLFLAFVPVSIIKSDTIGSDSAVTVFTDPVIIGNGDVVATFAALRGGFIIGGHNSTGLYKSRFPLSGEIAFYGGGLLLDSDIVLAGEVIIDNLGIIYGNKYAVNFSPTLNLIAGVLEPCTARYLSSVFTNIQILPTGTTIATSDWSHTDNFVAIGQSLLGVVGVPVDQEVVIYRFDGVRFVPVASTAVSLSLLKNVNSVRWHPNAYFLAAARSPSTPIIDVGAEVIIYTFDPITFVIGVASGLQVGTLTAPGSALSVEWHPSGNYLAIAETIATSLVAIHAVSGSGIINSSPLITAAPSPNRAINKEAVSWNAAGTSLAVGTAVSGANPTLLIYSFSSSTPSLTLNASAITTGDAVNSVSWNETYPTIVAAGTAGGALRIYDHNSVGGTLTQKVAIIGFSSAIKSLEWAHDGTCLVVGFALQVGGTEFRLYQYDPVAFTLTQSSVFDKTADVTSVRWSNDDQFVISTSGNQLAVYITDASMMSSGDCATFVDTNLILNADATITNACVLFKGDCSINGSNHNLIIDSSVYLLVDSNAKVLLKNVIIKGVQGINISCLGNTSSLTLQNVKWELDDYFTFSMGSVSIIDSFHIAGAGNTFAYRSTQPISVQQNSMFYLDAGVTFVYDPLSTSSQLITFVDNSSVLRIDNASLHTTSTGLALTKGSLMLSGNCNFSSEFPSTGTIGGGIQIGNGISSQDMIVQILPSAALNLISGELIYKNVETTSLELFNVISKIFIASGAHLDLYQSLPLGIGFLSLDAGSIVARASGTRVDGSINQLGRVIYTTIA